MTAEDRETGILNIDKPKGLTSHDVVARVRRLCRGCRVGHTGTLDPLATGVLVLCLGKATRLVEYLTDHDKSYLATVRFGVTTSTWDTEGEVLTERDATSLSREALEIALERFRGPIEQVPPMYSALKQDGHPLYRLARKGITIEREPRAVVIYDLTVVRWEPPEVVLRVDCSKGTYIRSLAHDLGEALGMGATLYGLTRLMAGPFRLEEATPLDQLLAEGTDDLWRRHLLPLRAALGDRPSVTVDEALGARIAHGQMVTLDLGPEVDFCCAYDQEGRLLAIMRRDPRSTLWHADKYLAA